MPQKRLLLLSGFVFYSLITFAQANDSVTYYFDANWEYCDKSEAMYYRRSIWKNEKLAAIDYYLSTKTPQMIGYYSDKKGEIKTDSFIYFFKNGIVKSTGKYLKNEAEGFWIANDSNALKLLEGDYEAGKKEDKWIEYYDTDLKESEGNYEVGKQHGKWKYYHSNGVLASLETYQGDNLFDMRCWDTLGMPLAICYEGESPEFPGGQHKMYDFLSKQTEYQDRLRADGIEGKAIVQFMIDTSGALSDFEIVRCTHKEFGDEALRVAKSMPRWTYYPNHNRWVRMRFTLPIKFSLN